MGGTSDDGPMPRTAVTLGTTSQHGNRIRRIRCRRCGVKFEAQAKEVIQVAIEPEVEPGGLSLLATDLGIEPESQSDEEKSGIDVGDLAIDVSDDAATRPRRTAYDAPPRNRGTTVFLMDGEFFTSMRRAWCFLPRSFFLASPC